MVVGAGRRAGLMSGMGSLKDVNLDDFDEPEDGNQSSSDVVKTAEQEKLAQLGIGHLSQQQDADTVRALVSLNARMVFLHSRSYHSKRSHKVLLRRSELRSSVSSSLSTGVDRISETRNQLGHAVSSALNMRESGLQNMLNQCCLVAGSLKKAILGIGTDSLPHTLTHSHTDYSLTHMQSQLNY